MKFVDSLCAALPILVPLLCYALYALYDAGRRKGREEGLRGKRL